MPYTEVSNNACAGKGGKLTNPEHTMENEALYGKGSDEGSSNHKDSAARSTARHQKMANKDDTDFGQAFNAGHGLQLSRGDGRSFSQFDNVVGRAMGSGVSPLHPQAYGRLGKKAGSASPAFDKRPDARAPGTPNRNRPESSATALPKFGDWDESNPSSGEGFTEIFDKARDQRRTGGALTAEESPWRREADASRQPAHPESTVSRNWFCRCFRPSTV